MDRMEVIECPGYTRVEKRHIATRVPVPEAAERPRADRRAPRFQARRRRADHRRVHARSGGARARARDRRRLPPRGDADRRGGDRPPRRRRRRGGRGDPRRAAVPAGPRRADERGGRGDRPGVDAVGRRHPLHRGDEDAGQRRGPRDGQLEERHERERRDGAVVRAEPRLGVRPRPRVFEGDRPAPARPEGRDAQGRSERRRDDVQRAGVAPSAVPGAARRRDDRRDHPSWQRPPGRRYQREAPRGSPRRDSRGARAQAQRAGPRRRPDGRPRRAPGASHPARRRGSSDRPRAARRGSARASRGRGRVGQPDSTARAPTRP